MHILLDKKYWSYKDERMLNATRYDSAQKLSTVLTSGDTFVYSIYWGDDTSAKQIKSKLRKIEKVCSFVGLKRTEPIKRGSCFYVEVN